MSFLPRPTAILPLSILLLLLIITSQISLSSGALTSSSSTSSTTSSSFSNPKPTPYNLTNKRVLVTGSSGGIGAKIATRLAHAGCHVLVHYHIRRESAISTCDQIQSIIGKGAGQCAGIVQCDFRSPKAIDALFTDVIDPLWGDGGLDILINNAGVVTKLHTDDDDDAMSSWHETMAVNLHAPLQLSRLAYRRMKRRGGGGGVIVNVSSIHGERSVDYMTSYAASKAALNSLTRGLALEYAPDGVRVNAVSPGIVTVERTVEYFEDISNVKLWEPHIPLGRPGTGEEVAEAVVYLCENGWSTGNVVTLDGGAMSRSNMPFRPRPPGKRSKDKDDDEGKGDVCGGVTFEKR